MLPVARWWYKWHYIVTISYIEFVSNHFTFLSCSPIGWVILVYIIWNCSFVYSQCWCWHDNMQVSTRFVVVYLTARVYWGSASKKKSLQFFFFPLNKGSLHIRMKCDSGVSWPKGNKSPSLMHDVSFGTYGEWWGDGAFSSSLRRGGGAFGVALFKPCRGQISWWHKWER